MSIALDQRPQTEQDAKKAPPQAVVRDAGEFLHDLVTLGELQVELVKDDARKGLGKMSRVAILFVAAAIVAVSAVPVALLAIGYAIALTGLSLAASLAIATAIGLIIAAGIGFAGYKLLKGMGSVFDRSKKEFSKNLLTLKNSMKRRGPAT